MSFWQKITSYFRREAKKEKSPYEPRSGAVSLFDTGQGSAMCIATVFRCVKLLSESVANLPLQYLRLKDGIYREVRDSRLDYLLNIQPDFAVNAFDHWRMVVQELLLEGNAYIVPVYNPVTMALERLALCGRGTVTHDTINDCYDICDLENGISGHYLENEIIHIKGLTLNSVKRGVSVLAYARLTTRIASTGDQETHNRFANGGNVRGFVANGQGVRGFGEYQDEQLAATARLLDNRFQDGERIVSLPGQLDFKQLSLSSTDMQFLESRKFTVREICRFFGVHPSFVFDDTSNNYKSAEQANVAFLSHTLAPLLRNIEVELRRKLVAPSLSGKYKFQFDRRNLHACDLDGMMNYRTRLLQIGTTVNEVRQMDNLPPVDGGDAVLVSANLRSISELGNRPSDVPADSNTEDATTNANDDEKE